MSVPPHLVVPGRVRAATASGDRPGRVTSALRGRPAAGRVRLSLIWGLGLLWLLDAALQFQPYMFTTAFPREVIGPTGDGNPVWVRGPLEWSASLMAEHILLFNAGFAMVQLLIAIGLFRRRTVRAALAASIGWALMVWWLGEGLGGVLTGPVSPQSGLPGAVLLYAVVAVLLWPRGAADGPARLRPQSVATSSPLRSCAVVGWLALWLGFAVEAVWAGDPRPGTEPAVALPVCFVLIALSTFGPPAVVRIGVAVAVVVSLVMWVVSQQFGGIATGRATDPNTGPVLVLLALCFWPVGRPGS